MGFKSLTGSELQGHAERGGDDKSVTLYIPGFAR
jgi:hypothetical protein